MKLPGDYKLCLFFLADFFSLFFNGSFVFIVLNTRHWKERRGRGWKTGGLQENWGKNTRNTWVGLKPTVSPALQGLSADQNTRQDWAGRLLILCPCLSRRALSPAPAVWRWRGGPWTTGLSGEGEPVPCDICCWQPPSSPAAPNCWWWTPTHGGE